MRSTARGVLDGDSRVVAEDVEEGDRLVRERLRIEVRHLQDTERALARAQGHADGRVLLIACGERRGTAVISDDQRLAMQRDPAGDARAERDADAGELIGRDAARKRVGELACSLIDHQQRPALRLKVAIHLLEDGVQDGGQIERRGERACGIVEDAQVLVGGTALDGVGHGLV